MVGLKQKKHSTVDVDVMVENMLNLYLGKKNDILPKIVMCFFPHKQLCLTHKNLVLLAFFKKFEN